ncbi:MAG: hypothetical protein ACYTAF_00255 [Planctomycetota bacterium]|jgi:hypothetical protein
MKRSAVALVLALCVFVVAGCFEIEQEFTLNPDGSGKVKFTVISRGSMNPFEETAEDPAEQVKTSVADLLQKSEGVEAWKDVSYEVLKDGRMSIKGTAYFKDMKKLKIHTGGGDGEGPMDKLVFKKDDAGNIVLEFETEEGAGEKPKPAEMTEEEIQKQIRIMRAQFQQQKPLIETFVKDMKVDMKFRLPGKIGDAGIFTEGPDNTIGIAFEGKKILESMEKVIMDDDLAREAALSGDDPMGQAPPDFLLEMMFGKKGEPRAVTTGELKPLFDYKSEAAGAKIAANLLKELGLEEKIVKKAPAPVPAAKGEGFADLAVTSVEMTHPAGADERFGQKAGLKFSLKGRFPGAVMKVSGGEVKKALADTGQDLLPKQQWDRRIHFANLTDDKAGVTFDVKMDYPAPNVKSITEISGVLTYLVSGGREEVDLGLTDLTKGAKGTKHGASIKNRQKSQWQQGHEELQLNLRVEMETIAEIVFFDAEGKKLEVRRSGHMSMGSDTTIDFSIEGTFPEKGKIVVQFHKDLKSFEVPFSIENVDLLGRPIK